MSCDRKIGPFDCCSVVQGDCLELMKQLPDGSVDAVITDPPYAGLKGGLKAKPTGGVAPRSECVTVGTPWGEDMTPLREAFRVARLGLMAFCSHHCAGMVPEIIGAPPIALIVWYKRNSMPPINNVPHYNTEFVWAFKKLPGLSWKNLSTMYDIPALQAGCMATERICRDGFALHPAQKPLQLMEELLSVGGDTVLDPYAGTGTTLVAAKKLGRHFLGFEISPEYCAIARDRIARVEAQPSLFEPKPKQEQLFCGACEETLPDEEIVAIHLAAGHEVRTPE